MIAVARKELIIWLVAVWPSVMAFTRLTRMAQWDFSQWLGYVTYFLGAVIIGIEGFLSFAPKTKERLPSWAISPWTMTIPMIFALISLSAFLLPIVANFSYARMYSTSIQDACNYSKIDGIRLIESEFSAIARKESNTLGSSTECVHRILDASKADFQHMTEVWIKEPDSQRTMYFLYPDTTWGEGIENVVCTLPWCENSNSAFRIKHFSAIYGSSPPPGMRPPFGGTALYVDSNPAFAAKFGWQISQCEKASPIYIQKFEKGFIIGIFQVNARDEEGQIYSIYNDHHWNAVPSEARVNVCGSGSF